MKRYFKLLIPIFLFAITVSAFAYVPASAAYETGYAVWDSEEDYLANPNAPDAAYEEGDLSLMLNAGVANKHYIVCYGDVELKTNFNVLNNANVIIDLNGNTLTVDTKGYFRVGTDSKYTPSSITIKNGTFVKGNGGYVQCFKPQYNSTINFDNVDLELHGSGNLVYGTGIRMIYFKDCNVNLSGSMNPIQIFSTTKVMADKIAALEGIPTREFDYIHSIVFDNSYLNLSDHTGKFLYATHSTDPEVVRHYEVSFLAGSSVDRIDNNFFVPSYQATVDSYAILNFEKGVKFAEKKVPICEGESAPHETLDIRFYNDISTDGVSAILKGRTEVIDDENYEQVEGQTPKLIWGTSNDEKFPYQLCNKICTVTLKIPNTDGTYTDTSFNIGDGATTSYSVSTRGFYEKDGDIYEEIHVGWATSPDATEYSEFITVTEEESTYYAVFVSEGPATVIEYASAEKDVIKSIVTGNTVSSAHIAKFDNGSYVYFTDRITGDIILDVTSSVNLESKSLTLDLNGKTLKRIGSISNAISLFDLSGSTLNVKNGKINVSMVGFATLNNGATLSLDDVDLSFDSYPAFTVNKGTVNLVSASSVKQNGNSTDIPVFVLGKSGSATVNITGGSVDVLGTVFTHTGSNTANNITVNLNGVEISADSIACIYNSATAAINNNTTLTLNMDDGCVSNVRQAFCVPLGKGGNPALQATFNVNGGTFTSDPADLEYGKLVLPEGKIIVSKDGVYSLLDKEIEVGFNMSFEYGFAVDFYIPVTLALDSAKSYKDTFQKDNLRITTVNGTDFYVVTVDGIDPSFALNTVTVALDFTEADVRYTSNVRFSPIEYFANELKSSNINDVKLTVSAMNYIEAVYKYYNVRIPNEFKALTATEKYASNLRTFAPTHQTADLGNIKDAFTGAQLYLSSDLAVRFNIRDGFSGTLTVDGTEYTVTDGKADGKTYIECKVDPRSLYQNKIKITGTSALGEISGVYSLHTYISNVGQNSSDLLKMLSALNIYCYETYIYYNQGEINPFIGSSPMVDVEYKK